MNAYALYCLRVLHDGTDTPERVAEHEAVHDLMRELGLARDADEDHALLLADVRALDRKVAVVSGFSEARDAQDKARLHAVARRQAAQARIGTTAERPGDALHVQEMRPCLDEHKGGCGGPVQLRPSLTGTGTPIPRCDRHWEARLEFQEKYDRAYPDSPIPPEWFDPEAAGERWDDD